MAEGTTKSTGDANGRAARSRGRKRAPRLSTRAIETTLAELAHEIRTPLTGILALGELLATAGLPPREREWAMAIKSTAEHLAMLTSLIVDAVRADTKRPGAAPRPDPAARVRAVAGGLARRPRRRARTSHARSTIAPDLPEVGDRRRDAAARARSKTSSTTR